MAWPSDWKHHLKVKLETLSILIGGALIVTAVFWLLLQGLTPFLIPQLPELWQSQLALWQHQPAELSLRQIKSQVGHWPHLSFWFVVLQLGQVLFAPIPGQLMGLLGGWLFGFWGGLSLTMLGLGLGSFLAMLIGRFGGRWLIDRLLSHTLLERFDHMVEESGLFTFFMLFLLPGLPDDALCLVAGMTPLSIPWLLIACLLGRLPGMAVLTWVGTELSRPDLTMQLTLGGIGLVSFALWFFQDPIEQAFAKWGKKKGVGSGE